MNRLRFTLSLYATVAVVTFGQCASAKHYCINNYSAAEIACPPPLVAGAATFAALFWPLYWSWAAWDALK